jgi:16S rRNA C967 or C1407 C5-methylase (RsmB/RsmF family)
LAFLESNPDFGLEDAGVAGAGTIGSPVMDGHALQTLPHRDRTAGFFIARLRRG